MRSRHFIQTVAVLAATALLVPLAATSAAGAPSSSARVDAIVLLDHTPGSGDEARVTGLGGTVGRRLENINVLTVSLPEAALAALSRQPGVLSVERARDDITFHDHATTASNPELQWGVNRIDAEIAHHDPGGPLLRDGVNRGWTGVGVVVATLDTGIDVDHLEFEDRIDSRAMSFAGRNPSTNVTDKNNHGSHVAGIIGAANDGTGVVGVAPDVTLLPIQIAKGSRIKDAAILAALNYLLTLSPPPDVVNMSFGSSQPSVAEEDAINLLAAAGVTLVASAGNESAVTPGFPAGYDAVIAVGSTTVDDTLSSFSNTGLGSDDLVAPGSSIYSTSKDGGSLHMSGTSMSSPHVAGAAALVVQSGRDPRTELTGSSENFLPDPLEQGAGLLDVAAAFALDSDNNLDLGNQPPVVDAGADDTVIIAASVSLTGVASDSNGDPLSVAWTIESAPALSAGLFSAASNLITDFTPDLAGVYVLKLTATETVTTEPLAGSDTVVITALDSGSIVRYGVALIDIFRTTQGRWENVNFVVTIEDEHGAPVDGASVVVDITRPGRTFSDLIASTNGNGEASFRIRRAVDSLYSILVRDVSHTDVTIVWDGIQKTASE